MLTLRFAADKKRYRDGRPTGQIPEKTGAADDTGVIIKMRSFTILIV